MRFVVSNLPSRILLASFAFAVSFIYLIEDREIPAESAQQDKLLDHPSWLGPYVPTPPEVIDVMLKLATVREGDILYDLGSGDGRIIIRQQRSAALIRLALSLTKNFARRRGLLSESVIWKGKSG
jgi:hypothetical protein